MEIIGKVISVLEPMKFVSKKDGTEYVKNTFVIETSGDYPKKLALSVMGEDKFAQMGIVMGKTYNVSFDISSREWNGKWFTEASAWRAVCTEGDSQQPARNYNNAPQASSPAPQMNDSSDALPF